MVLGSTELGDLGFFPVLSVVSILVFTIGSADGVVWVVFLVKWDAMEGDGRVCLPLFLVRRARAGFLSLWVLFWRPPLEIEERYEVFLLLLEGMI